MSDDYYSPENIDRWLRQWPLLCSLAETPGTSRHHLDSDHRTAGPCLDSVRLGSGGRAPDMLIWADVRADIQHAYAQLAIGSTERRVVWERMAQPASLRVVAVRIGSRYSIVLEAYTVAVARGAGRVSDENAILLIIVGQFVGGVVWGWAVRR